MNYFNHHVNKPMGHVWDLFTELSEATQVKRTEPMQSVAFEYSIELINAAMNGRIDLEEGEEFNLSAYSYGCKKNENLNKRNDAKKELHIVDDVAQGESEQDGRVGFGDISMRRLGTTDKNLEQVIESRAFEETLLQLLGIRSDIIIEYGVDIVRALDRSMDGDENALNTIQFVVGKNQKVEELITTLCSTNSEVLQERLREVA